ncbi:hypothetical protein EQV77_10400 [Halobacillus fulvus]|nr:hypothetical protein EQV77_10400 [Halobacillus fulvus]
MKKPDILLFGTFHFSMEPQAVNEQMEDILRIVKQLEAYQPTKIAVEKSFLVEEELDRKYRDFQDGKLTLTYDEVEQFAFRLAHALDHPTLYPVDEIVDMTSPSLNQVFEWAKEHQPELFTEIAAIQGKLQEMDTSTSLIERLKTINHPDYIRTLQKIYMKLTLVGDRQHQVGVSWLKQWHHRDLAIAANLARITEPEDRVLMLVGGDHLHLLRQFLHDSGDFSLSDVNDYL